MTNDISDGHDPGATPGRKIMVIRLPDGSYFRRFKQRLARYGDHGHERRRSCQGTMAVGDAKQFAPGSAQIGEGGENPAPQRRDGDGEGNRDRRPGQEVSPREDAPCTITTRPRQRRPRSSAPRAAPRDRTPPFRRQLVPRLDAAGRRPLGPASGGGSAFRAGQPGGLEQARAKLRRLGIDAEPEEVKIVIGGTPTN